MRSVEAALASVQNPLPSVPSPANDPTDGLLTLSPNMASTQDEPSITTITTTTTTEAGVTLGVDSLCISDKMTTTATTATTSQERDTMTPSSTVSFSTFSSPPLMESSPLSPEATSATTPSITPLARSPGSLPATDPLRVSPSPSNAFSMSSGNVAGVMEAPLPGEEGLAGGRELKSVDSSKRKRNRRL